MATDSTELTFVRCPSCRSLVPAVSTRCRMCGAGLDANATPEAGEQDKKGGRVRQRTMSQPQSELNSAVSKLRNEEEAPEPVAPVRATPTPAAPIRTEVVAPPAPTAAPQQMVQEEEEVDPLSAYIEEVDEEPAATTATAVDPEQQESHEAASSTEHRNGAAAKTPEPVAAGISSTGVASIPAAHILVGKPAAKPPVAPRVETEISTAPEEIS
ncbi:MAG: hypothetical protein K1X79_12875, partial [Oligoflexia bacterium]|nr:hypothetical protein [Oligoflexia bacterium]